MKTYTVFVVQGYESATPDGSLNDVTGMELIADTEKQAIKKAKTFIKKKYYRISGVIEKYVDTGHNNTI